MEFIQGLGSRKKALKAVVTKRPTEKEGNGDSKMTNGELTDDQPLSPVGRLFHQPHFNCYIIMIMGWKTRIDYDAIKTGLEDTVLKHPRFSSIQVMDEIKSGAMKWVPTNVDIENHVIIPDLDPNMDSPDQFVEDYVSDLSKTTMDMSKPLWEVHLLDVKTSEAKSVGVFRIHHSLGDGVSLISLLLAYTRKTANPEASPTVPVKEERVLRSQGRFCWLFVALWAVFWLVWNTVVDLLMLGATLIFLTDTTPLKGGPGVEFTPKRFVHRTLSLDDIKLVKNALNTKFRNRAVLHTCMQPQEDTINDVLLGITAAGLSRYLNRRYGDHEKDEGATEKRNNLPKNIKLRANLMVNVRPSSGIPAMVDMMKNKIDDKWGNLIGFVLLPFTIALRGDPLDYVRTMKATMDRKKLSLEAAFTFAISTLCDKSVGIKLADALCHNIFSHTTMTFSNIVGPLEEISLYGHPIAYLALSVYGHPHAVTLHFLSYMNKMAMVLAVDEDAVPDPHQLCDDLEESLNLIKEAVVARG